MLEYKLPVAPRRVAMSGLTEGLTIIINWQCFKSPLVHRRNNIKLLDLKF